MAWMQQMYSQYLKQYLLYMHSGAVNFVQPDLGVDSVQDGLQVQREQVWHGRETFDVAIFHSCNLTPFHHWHIDSDSIPKDLFCISNAMIFIISAAV